MRPSLKHALLLLASYSPSIYPSQERLASEMGVDRRTVNRRLRALEDLGYIARERRPGRTTVYRLWISSDAPVPKPVALASHKGEQEESVGYEDDDDYLRGL